MKICLFTPTLNVGGYEKLVVQYANYFSKNDLDHVILLCCNDDGELKDQISKDVEIVCLHCRTKSLVFKLIYFIKRYQPDVFYCGFRIYNAIAILAREFSAKKSLRIIISQHGFEDNSKFVCLFYRNVFKKADGFVAVSKSVFDYEKCLLHLTCPSCVINNPVIDNTMCNLDCDDKWFISDDPILVTCGRLSQDKNTVLAISILKMLHRNYPRSKLLIIGDGTEKKELKKYVTESNLTEYVRFLGFVKNTIQYMAKCTVYLHLSDHEGFGNTVVEAMYAGLPIVTTDCGGPVEIITKNESGVCFGNGRAVDSVQRGYDAVLYVIDNKDKFSHNKQKSLEYTVENKGSLLLKFMKGDFVTEN